MSIRRVLILANFEKDAVRELATELEPWLAERVDEVRLETDIRAFCARRVGRGADERAADRPDLAVVLGGDGALLGAVRAFAEDPVPTLGINLGRVGFLASTPSARWRDTLESVLGGRCVLEPRTRLVAHWSTDAGGARAFALNDVALQRGAHQGMLWASLSVNGTWVTDYRADGLIVATPSGSTAYALSAGGPILEPAVDALVVTPICSHGLSSRPIVLDGAGELTIEVLQSAGITTLAVDGQSFNPLRQGEVVTLRRHPEGYPLYAMPGLDPYRRLRERLGWGSAGPHGGRDGS
jgi:NAD+ kinase